MSKTSSTLLAAKQDAETELGSGGVRFSTICCGLKRVLKHHDVLAPHFASFATSVGIMRHVVSMVANHVVLSGAVIEKGDVFLFYTRVWSAVDRRSNGVKDTSTTHFDREVAAFFHQHDCRALPDFKVPVMCRQQECNALATAAKEHLQTFPDRMIRWFTAKMATLFWHHNTPCNPECKRDAGRLWKLLLAAKDDSTFARDLRIALRDQRFEGIRDDLQACVYMEYYHLASFREEGAVPLSRAVHTAKHAHLLLPHMQRISVQCEALLHGMHGALPQAPEQDAEELQYDEVLEQDDDGAPDPVVGTPGFRWPKGGYPKPFCVLPNAKLKRAMVYFGATELKHMISSLCGRGKRKREDIVSDLKACPTPEEMYPFLFDFKRIKGKHLGEAHNDEKRWRFSNFRTDGVKICLTFCSGMSSAIPSQNVCCLCDAGYSIPVPLQDVQVNDTQRGLFRIEPERNDIAEGSVDPTNVITVVDPGFHRPIQTASISAGALMHETMSPMSLSQQASFDHVDYNVWLEESGRSQREQEERRRRVVNASYNNALGALSVVRKRSCLNYLAYTQTALATLEARAGELVAFERCMFRWKYERKLQSFLDKVADKLFCRTTKRACRHSNYRTMSLDERKELVKRLRHAQSRTHLKHVVFFGDGTFSCTQRGHASIPKKRLLKQLAVRGLTFLLCERNTSLRCPCGHDDLKNGDSIDGMRVRVHQTDGGVCNVLHNVKDRDELACTNMLLACATACHRAPWPGHLTRH